MITSAANRGWEGDVEITDLAKAGLPVASVVRSAKIATIDPGDADYLGRVPLDVLEVVHRHLAALLPPPSA